VSALIIDVTGKNMPTTPPDPPDPRPEESTPHDPAPAYPGQEVSAGDQQPSGAWGAHLPATRFDPADPLISNDYNGWFRRGFGVVTAGWRALLLLQLIFVTPLVAALVPAQIYFDRKQHEVMAHVGTGNPGFRFADLLPAYGVLAVAGMIGGLSYSLGVLATVRMTVTIASGGTPSIGAAIRVALRRLPASIGWGIPAGLMMVVAVLLCFLPIFYVAPVFTLLPAVVLFERGNAIARCFRLFHIDLGSATARIATTFGLGLGVGAVVGILTLIATVVTKGGSLVDPAAAVSTTALVTGSVITTVLSGLRYLIVGALITPFTVATYADLRARTEPFTSAQLAAEA
jgi:hypothetical protein